jgi:hypothetical protein
MMKYVDIFDFDGVLAEPLEEALFTMEDTIHDKEFIKVMSELQRLDLSVESKSSQRYICIQAALLRMGVGINTGPAFEYAGRLPFHVLSARCDRFAVTRMHQFLVRHDLRPIKTMHTDHLAKGEMLKVLLERHPDVTYNYFEDSPRHIESAMGIKSERLNVWRVDNIMEPFYTSAHKFYISQILERYL